MSSPCQGGHGKGTKYTYAELQGLWINAGGPKSRAPLMAAIAEAESGGCSAAYNASGASGLWQILGTPFQGNVWDPATNAKMAVSKYHSQGLGAWETYTNGAYKAFLGKSSPNLNVPSPGSNTTTGPSGQTVTLSAAATNPNACAWTFGGLPTSFGNIGQFCVISKSQLRAVIGGLFLATGGIAVMSGVSLMAAAAALPALEAGAGALVPIGRVRALPGRYGSAVGGSGGSSGGGGDGGREPYVSGGQEYGTTRRATPASTGRRVVSERRAAQRRRKPPADATSTA